MLGVLALVVASAAMSLTIDLEKPLHRIAVSVGMVDKKKKKKAQKAARKREMLTAEVYCNKEERKEVKRALKKNKKLRKAMTRAKLVREAEKRKGKSA